MRGPIARTTMVAQSNLRPENWYSRVVGWMVGLSVAEEKGLGFNFPHGQRRRGGGV